MTLIRKKSTIIGPLHSRLKTYKTLVHKINIKGSLTNYILKSKSLTWSPSLGKKDIKSGSKNESQIKQLAIRATNEINLKLQSVFDPHFNCDNLSTEFLYKKTKYKLPPNQYNPKRKWRRQNHTSIVEYLAEFNKLDSIQNESELNIPQISLESKFGGLLSQLTFPSPALIFIPSDNTDQAFKVKLLITPEFFQPRIHLAQFGRKINVVFSQQNFSTQVYTTLASYFVCIALCFQLVLQSTNQTLYLDAYVSDKFNSKSLKKSWLSLEVGQVGWSFGLHYAVKTPSSNLLDNTIDGLKFKF